MLDRSSGVCAPRFVIAHIANSSEEEEEEKEMPLDRKRGLRELFVNRAKGLAPKDALGPKLPSSSSPPPLPIVNPFAPANLKKSKKDKEVAEEGELIPHNEEVPPKLQ